MDDVDFAAGGVDEAPIDGTSYVRKDAGWVAPAAPGISDAPNDGTPYLRKSAAWVVPDYLTLLNRPLAETQVYDLYRAGTVAGVSSWAGTIATKPGGAPTTITVTNVSGYEAALVPTATNQLAKMRMYNTTRGTYMLISNHVVGTHTTTFTANVPAGWTVGDVITIASQTVSGGGLGWVDLEIVSTLTGKSFLFLYFQFVGGTGSYTGVYTHPFEAYAETKTILAVLDPGQWGGQYRGDSL